MNIPEITKIEEVTKEIQRLMRIQDWDIEIELLNDREMDSACKRDYIPGGHCLRNRFFREATISLNKDSEQFKDDWYAVLIHEMIHILLDEFSDFFDNTLFKMIDADYRERMEDKYTFENEKLTCMITRMFINLYPVSNFIKEGDT